MYNYSDRVPIKRYLLFTTMNGNIWIFYCYIKLKQQKNKENSYYVQDFHAFYTDFLDIVGKNFDVVCCKK
jgi:hypothetical protein